MSSRSNARKRSATRDNPADKQAILDAYGNGAVAVLQSIRDGTVDEVELDKLYNFTLTAMVVLELVPLETFRRAQRIVVTRGKIGIGHKVVMDPKLEGMEYGTDDESGTSAADDAGAGSGSGEDVSGMAHAPGAEGSDCC